MGNRVTFLAHSTPDTRHLSPVSHFWRVRMVFWLALALATAWLLWYMVAVPGASYRGALKPLTPDENLLAGNLRRHVAAIASREHNLWSRPALEEAAQYIERTLAGTGYTVAKQPIATEL